MCSKPPFEDCASPVEWVMLPIVVRRRARWTGCRRQAVLLRREVVFVALLQAVGL
jgi:hypothetical protein